MENLSNDPLVKNLVCPSCNSFNRQENRYCSNCGFEFIDVGETSGPCLSVLTNDQSSVVFPVKEGATTIGRHIDNSIVINDEQISKNHAVIFTEDLKVWIEDLKSRNGVYLNGKRITSQCLLHDGAMIRLGNTILRFENRRNR